MTGAAIYPSLAGKRVIVTGGGSGIGEAIVEGFVRQGAAVAFIDIADDPSQALVKRLDGATPPPVYEYCDLTDCAALERVLADLVQRLGGCDVLVNNAACDDRLGPGAITPAQWDAGMAVNLRHHYFSAQAVLPAMRQAGGGSIINLGSISWHLALPELTIYETAKAAIEGLTRSLARDLGGDNIRVNAIIPGNVQTERQLRWYSPEGEAEIVAAQFLKGRIQPADVAAMALFLASDDARVCTGHMYWVDAGWR